MELKDKWVWITGASSGIGYELARQCAQQQAHLVLSARNAEALERLARLIEQEYGVKCWVYAFDLEDKSISADEHVKAVVSRVGMLPDCLINNAGLSQRSFAMDTSEVVERRIMELDFFAPVGLSKAFIRLNEHDSPIKIVLIASVAGKIGSPRRSVYSAAKHALIGYGDTLRAELRNSNISILTVCPGFVNTPVSIHALTGDGSPLGVMEKATKNGLDVTYCVAKIIIAIKRDRHEQIIASGLALLGYYLHRISPNLYHRLMQKIDSP